MDNQNEDKNEDWDWVKDAREILGSPEEPLIPLNNGLEENSSLDAPVFTLENLLNREFPDTGWVVETLIPAQGLVALSGAPGNYKSWITQHLAISVASGTQLFDKFSTNQGSVLIIDKENNLRLVKQRFEALQCQSSLSIYFFDLELIDFTTENQDSLDLVCNFVSNNDIKLVIIDSLIRSHKQDENSASAMAQVFGVIRKIQDAGAAVLFTHHHRKQSAFNRSGASESLRGSSDILAAVDCHLAVDKLEDGIKVTQTKLRQQQSIKPFKIKLESLPESEEKVRFVYVGEVEEDKIKKEDAKEVILVLLKEGKLKRQELINQLVQDGICAKRTAEDALSELNKDGRIIHTTSKPYIYSLPSDDSANRNTIYDSRNAEPLTEAIQSELSYLEENQYET